MKGKKRTLKEIALFLLDKYHDAETAVIYEYSGNVNGESKKLDEECEALREEINEAGTTGDLISREDALEALKKRWEEQKEQFRKCPRIPHHYYDGNLEAQAVINSMPSVSTEGRKKGEWLVTILANEGYEYAIRYACTACGASTVLTKEARDRFGFRFCPCCGAEMEGRRME